jgi:hypothetical protein
MNGLNTEAAPYNPEQYAAHKIDWTGRAAKGKLLVLRRGPDTVTGARQWECLCACGRGFILTDDQLENYQFQPCACRLWRR